MAQLVRRVCVFAAATTACLGLAASSGTTADAGFSADAALRQYQAQVLDPQADNGERVMLPAHSVKHHGHTMTAGMSMPKAEGGKWKYDIPFDATFNAIHQIASPTGRKILLVAGSGNSSADFDAGTFRSFTGTKTLYAFNFSTEQYERLSDMEVGRWYPSVINGADGRSLIVSGLGTDGVITDTSCFVGDVRDQNVMVMGGGWPATDSTSVIKLDEVDPAYHDGPPLLTPKANLSCLTLPDGTLFETNGGTANTVAGASTEASFLHNVAGPWTSANPLPDGEHRVYHSLLFLMDSGKVVSMTSNPQGGTGTRSTSLLIYSPPYLFKGPRPVIAGAPREMAHGATYTIDATATDATVDRITLTAASSPTHGSDNNQRYASLPVTSGQITIPESRTMLPPGWYRLWAVDSLGRVSKCKWVHLDL